VKNNMSRKDTKYSLKQLGVKPTFGVMMTMPLKKYALITLAIMGIIIFHGVVIIICVRISGYSSSDVFWFGPIGSFF
jgi:hypothetical protein